MSEVDTRSFMEEQFMAHGVFYRTLKHDLAINCPFHSNSGRKQLLNIHFDGAPAHCWSCKWRGTYNDVATKLGLKKMPNTTEYAYVKLDRAIAELRTPRGRISLPNGLERFDEEYRGLDSEFLERFESYKWFDPQSAAYRILWPIRFNGKLQGYTAGRLDGETMPKYRHGPADVIQTRRILWPIDDEEIQDIVVLVEGPFSALRLLSFGIPAVAILGADSWSQQKITMLHQRHTPIRHVIIAMDGDDAGWGAACAIFKSIKDRFESVQVFECPDEKDPGDMSGKHIRRLWTIIEALKAQSSASDDERPLHAAG